MIFDALAGHRMIGMVQPKQPGGFAGDGMPADDGRPKVHKVGCAGRIVSFNETEDGRLLLALTGVCRFEIGRELDLAHGGYRRVSSLFSPYRADLDHADEQVELDRERADGGARRLLPRPQPVDRLGSGEAGRRRQPRDLAVDGAARSARPRSRRCWRLPTRTARAKLLIAFLEMDAFGQPSDDPPPGQLSRPMRGMTRRRRA